MNFLKDGLSIDETKASVLIVLTIVSVVFGLVMYKINGDITDNLVEIIKFLILSIAGVNVANTLTNFFDRYRG